MKHSYLFFLLFFIISVSVSYASTCDNTFNITPCDLNSSAIYFSASSDILSYSPILFTQNNSNIIKSKLDFGINNSILFSSASEVITISTDTIIISDLKFPFNDIYIVGSGTIYNVATYTITPLENIFYYISDYTKPVITITSPINNSDVTNFNGIINLNYSDGNYGSCWGSINEGIINSTYYEATGTVTSVQVLSNTSGLFNISIWCKDNYNNLNTLKINISNTITNLDTSGGTSYECTYDNQCDTNYVCSDNVCIYNGDEEPMGLFSLPQTLNSMASTNTETNNEATSGVGSGGIAQNNLNDIKSTINETTSNVIETLPSFIARLKDTNKNENGKCEDAEWPLIDKDCQLNSEALTCSGNNRCMFTEIWFAKLLMILGAIIIVIFAFNRTRKDLLIWVGLIVVMLIINFCTNIFQVIESKKIADVGSDIVLTPSGINSNIITLIGQYVWKSNPYGGFVVILLGCLGLWYLYFYVLKKPTPTYNKKRLNNG